MVNTSSNNISHLIKYLSETHFEDFVDRVEFITDGLLDDYFYFVYVKNYQYSLSIKDFLTGPKIGTAIKYQIEGSEKTILAEQFYSKIRKYIGTKYNFILVGENSKTKELEIIQ